jgi:hypothetical protein
LPLYVYPDTGSSGTSVWRTACDTMDPSGGQSRIIMNFGLGVGGVGGGPEGASYPNPEVAGLDAITYCHARGIKIIGYVDTDFGARIKADVETDISDWYRLYPAIDGIFFDLVNNQAEEVSNPTDNELISAYYHDLWSYVQHTAPSSAQAGVVGNPGNVDEESTWLLGSPSSSTRGVNELVVFEGTGTCYREWFSHTLTGTCATVYGTAGEPSWVPVWPNPNDIATLIYGETEDNIPTDCSDTKVENSGLVMVSDGDGTWTTFPSASFWATFLTYCN